ncbi:MAG: methyl-accepting chemotaxis protein [Nitrospira sp.]|nr:methyl-accepting chemotaxis protein [Nitrospira sp.]
MSRPRFRRHFLWDTVQPRFLGLSFCYVVVVIAAVAGALFVPLMLELNHLPLSSVEAQRVADQFELLHSRFWPVVAVVSVLLLVHGVFFSHRIAGPLYRFRRIFQSVASGDLTVRTSIRKADYLHVEAQCLGEMVDALREKIGRIEAHHADIAPQLERLKAAAACGALREVEQEADRLRATVEQLTRAMEPFQTTPNVIEARPVQLPSASGF